MRQAKSNRNRSKPKKSISAQFAEMFKEAESHVEFWKEGERLEKDRADRAEKEVARLRKLIRKLKDQIRATGISDKNTE